MENIIILIFLKTNAKIDVISCPPITESKTLEISLIKYRITEKTMTQNNEQRTIIEGLSLGNEANNQIADVVAGRTAKMLDQSLQENFETVLEAKLNMAVQETIDFLKRI